MKPIDKAIRAAGTLTELASRLKVSPQMVFNWRKRGVPAGWCRAVEAAVDGAVTAEELQPRIFRKAAVPPSGEKVQAA